MNIYHYNPETFDFIAAGIADASPLEGGVFLVPAYATDLLPPAFDPATHTCRFMDDVWELAEIPAPVPDPETPPKTVAEIKIITCAVIDQTAGITRQKYITTSPGQEATYTEKARQCEAYKADGYPVIPDPVAHAYVIAEKNAKGGATTYQQACDAILVERDQWSVLGAKIEEARRKAKIAINAAMTSENVETAKTAGLTELSTL